MGCTRSQFEPLICQRDEAEFISHQKSHCESNIFTSQASSDISLVKFGKTGNTNNSLCSQSGWFDKIPELATFLLLFLLALTLYRRWQARRRAKAIRRALGFDAKSNVVSLPTVSSSSGDSTWKAMGSRYLD